MFNPNVYVKKEGMIFNLAVVLFDAASTMSWRHCVSLWKWKYFDLVDLGLNAQIWFFAEICCAVVHIVI